MIPKQVLPIGGKSTIDKLEPKAREYITTDGLGLYLVITSKGSKLWHFKYTLNGVRKKISFGTYPAVTLSHARKKREEARELVAKGIDPGEVKKLQKVQIGDAGLGRNHSDENEATFEAIAQEWYQKFSPTWAASHAKRVIARLTNHIFPHIGDKEISELAPSDVLKVLLDIVSRGSFDTALRLKIVCGQIFRYAVATGRAKTDVTRFLNGGLPRPIKRRMAAITKPEEVACLLQSIYAYEGTVVVRSALKLASLFFLRPGELWQSEWKEIDFDAKEFNIPIHRLKLPLRSKLARRGDFHLVPLADQAMEILRELQSVTGDSKYLFPCVRSKERPMSQGAALNALRRMGYAKDQMCCHGFRAMARTLLDEVLGFRPDVIEHQLGHVVRDPNRRAYNRTSFRIYRKTMMQVWANYLDDLRLGRKSPLVLRGLCAVCGHPTRLKRDHYMEPVHG